MAETVSFDGLINALASDGVTAYYRGEEGLKPDAHTLRVWNTDRVETFLLPREHQKEAAETFRRLGLNFCAVEKPGQANRSIDWYPYGSQTDENLPRGGVSFLNYVQR